jgi:hypothetical protein
MADPVTLAAIGAVAGAATNKKDPIKGALLGATLGYGGGAFAPALMGGSAAAAPAAGLTGITPMGAQAAAGLTSGAASATAPTMMSKLMAPQSLMAGAQLAGALQPKPPVAQAMPLRPGQQVPITLDQIRAIDAGMFDTIPMDRRMMTMRSHFGAPPVPFLQDLEPIESRRLSLL